MADGVSQLLETAPRAVPFGARCPRPMNVLLLEPWTRSPHDGFADGLAAHSRHYVRTVATAAQSWASRMQGGAVSLAEKARAATWDAAPRWMPDLLVATDRVNLPAFLALTRRDVARVPVLYVLHENRLNDLRRAEADPAPDGRDLTYAYVHVLSMLAADRVVFNSQFHLDAFFGALPDLLRRPPGDAHVGYLPGLLAKSSVLHPGLDLAALDAVRLAAEAQRAREPGPPVLLWNPQHEADEALDAFFRVVNRLGDVGTRFRLVLAGETIAEPSAASETAFAEARRRHGDRILHAGVAGSFADYAALLWRSDIVVSTGRHAFFDLPVLEAVHCGCHPLLPNRLAYPEMIPPALHRPLLHAPVLYEAEDDLFATLRRLLGGSDLPLPRDVLARIPAPLAWPVHAERFDALFEEMGTRQSGDGRQAQG